MWLCDMLVGSVFSDESGRKVRPAVAIISRGYSRARQEVIVAAITSNIRRRLFGDHLIADWKGRLALPAEEASRVA